MINQGVVDVGIIFTFQMGFFSGTLELNGVLVKAVYWEMINRGFTVVIINIIILVTVRHPVYIIG